MKEEKERSRFSWEKMVFFPWWNKIGGRVRYLFKKEQGHERACLCINLLQIFAKISILASAHILPCLHFSSTDLIILRGDNNKIKNGSTSLNTERWFSLSDFFFGM